MKYNLLYMADLLPPEEIEYGKHRTFFVLSNLRFGQCTLILYATCPNLQSISQIKK